MSKTAICMRVWLIAVVVIISIGVFSITPHIHAYSCCGNVSTGSCEPCGGPSGCWGCGSGPGSTCSSTEPSCGWENGSCTMVGGGHTVTVDFCECPENASQCNAPTCDESSCGSWGPDSGCGQMGCAEDEKHQVRSCTDSDCQVERCQHYDSCVATPTPTLGTVLNLVGSCSQFGGPINLTWNYAATSGQYFKISRSYTHGGYVENLPNHATTAISPIPVRNFSDIRSGTNSIFSGPYNYRVTPCYDAVNCGNPSQQETVVCPTVAPLSGFTAQCIYPYDRIKVDWAQSNPAPPFAETNRHLARIVGTNTNLRYRSLAASIVSFTDTSITPGVEYGYNIRRCYTEYGTGPGECRYNSPYTGHQENEVCRIQAQCLNSALTYGVGCDGANGCYRGGIIQSYRPHGYNGDSTQPPPFNSGLGFNVNSNTKIGSNPPVSCNGVNCTNYVVGATIPLGETIYFKTNVQWTATSSICIPGSTWYNNSPPHSSSSCVNGCTSSIQVICNPSVWGNWSTCSQTCSQFRTSECSVTEYRACTGGSCVPPPPDPSATLVPPTSTPIQPTNTPPPGATITPTWTPIPTHTPTRTPTPIGSGSTPTNTPTLIPTLPLNTITPTYTLTPTPTLPGYSEVRVNGQYQQQTGVYIRTAPGQLSDTSLPIESVSLRSLLSRNIVSGQTYCHESPVCTRLPAGGGSTYSQYRCSVPLPPNCTIDSPQTFYSSSAMTFPHSLSYVGIDAAINVAGSPPPSSFVAPVTFDYTRSTGWIKFIGTDVLRSDSENFINAIPLITDRFNADTGGVPYVTGDTVDMGHATMIDVFSAGQVGGLMGGSVDNLPSDSLSQFGATIPSYQVNMSAGNDLSSYVDTLFASKPIAILPPPTGSSSGVDIILSPDTISTNKTGDLNINSLTLTSGTANVLIVTDQNGDLADVTFNEDLIVDTNTSLMIIARNITLASTVSVAEAVFVTSERLSTSAGDTPLKITGNVVALGGVEQERARGDRDHARPSVLMVFDTRAYMQLMPLLSTKDSKYMVVE